MTLIKSLFGAALLMLCCLIVLESLEKLDDGVFQIISRLKRQEHTNSHLNVENIRYKFIFDHATIFYE